MSVDAIGNFLTALRNAIMASKPFVVTPHSKMNAEIMNILQKEGFIKSGEVINSDDITKKQLKIVLKYVDGESVIHSLERISKPSRRVYVGGNKIKPVIDGLGISILSTNKGVITDKQVKSQASLVGGEVLCTIW